MLFLNLIACIDHNLRVVRQVELIGFAVRSLDFQSAVTGGHLYDVTMTGSEITGRQLAGDFTGMFRTEEFPLAQAAEYTTRVEGSHGQLGTRLPDTLCGDNTDGLTDINNLVAG